MSVILVHGSVETKTDPPYMLGLEAAALTAYQELARGHDRLTAAEKAVNELENNPLYNAGLGSVLNRDGYVEVDGAIMDGVTGKFAAVAAMQEVRHAVSVARKVMEESRHVVLAGTGATLFAREHGFSADNCITAVQLASWETAIHLKRSGKEVEFSAFTGLIKESDTVGCVLLDDHGGLAAASSTGGSFLKLPGRVGDTPYIGGGIFASSYCAVVCTGRGEAFISTLTAKFVEEEIKSGSHPQEAATKAIHRLHRLTGEFGGILVVDSSGRAAAVHNCVSFPVAMIRNGILEQVPLVQLPSHNTDTFETSDVT
ncbi:MAG: isoaspartyl peptidase/L-asparaginase family protein [Paenibacillus sp.]|uniref:Isoaspartyl peptidase/L-asparaginase family protein n=1 Tax=Paenibacillus timonensis TaxID=225915 RepID=A0ABW3SBL2_9BACL|nr:MULTISPECIES: isoaspartyl peptidase/L-asparaginase family protein [Paenibacillus]MCH1640275.1 isoaspartyl peptidase/L-asparaginase family protein [Paenibacillus timonensis]MDU4697210.1 isoaspartyl peptidase/L-asparaginase family protein [Paenibacillus sp.]